ncbi:hypothetical protein LEMLEM_LOCUS6486, partial [Lemmus lemmus]
KESQLNSGEEKPGIYCFCLAFGYRDRNLLMGCSAFNPEGSTSSPEFKLHKLIHEISYTKS